MCEKHLGQCFVLTALHRLPSHSSVLTFQALIFFMTVFKSEVINQSVLTGLKILIIDFLRNIRNAVSILAAYRLVIFYIYAAWIQI